jgi:hypothetical protein
VCVLCVVVCVCVRVEGGWVGRTECVLTHVAPFPASNTPLCLFFFACAAPDQRNLLEIVDIQTNRMRPMPIKLEAVNLKDFAQLDERYHIAKLTHRCVCACVCGHVCVCVCLCVCVCV